jgi:hypothetical protein
MYIVHDKLNISQENTEYLQSVGGGFGHKKTAGRLWPAQTTVKVN